MRLSRVRGYIGLFDPAIDAMASTVIPVGMQMAPTPTPFHVTLFSKHEVALVDKEKLSRFLETEVSLPVDLGLGQHSSKASSVYFKVLWWPDGIRMRNEAGLGWKDFHITLSETDVHDVDKGISTLIRPHQSISSVDTALVAESLHSLLTSRSSAERALLNAARLIVSDGDLSQITDKHFDTLRHLLQKAEPGLCRNYIVSYVRSHPESIAANLRYADLAAGEKRPKVAMAHYVEAYCLAQAGTKPAHSQAVASQCVKGIVTCGDQTEYLPLFTTAEIDQGVHLELPDEDDNFNLYPGPRLKREITEEFITRASKSMESTYAARYEALEPRERMHVPMRWVTETYKLPRFFRWLIPYKLAVMSTPKIPADITILRTKCSISLFITLTKETPLPKEWFTGFKEGCRNVFLPVENYKAPTIEQVDHFIDLVTALPQDEAALVHCGGGKGRAGTFAACYISACGFSMHRAAYPVFSATQSMAILRTMRPGSIETKEQEVFIAKYVQHLYKVISEPVSILPEPELPLVINGALPRNPVAHRLLRIPGQR